MIQKMKLNETKNIAGGRDGVIKITRVKKFVNCEHRSTEFFVAQFCPGYTEPLAYESFDNESEAYNFAIHLSPCPGQTVTPIETASKCIEAWGDSYSIS